MKFYIPIVRRREQQPFLMLVEQAAQFKSLWFQLEIVEDWKSERKFWTSASRLGYDIGLHKLLHAAAGSDLYTSQDDVIVRLCYVQANKSPTMDLREMSSQVITPRTLPAQLDGDGRCNRTCSRRVPHEQGFCAVLDRRRKHCAPTR